MKTPLAKLAQVKLKAAVDTGKVVKAKGCEKCGSRPYRKLHGHHQDYTKPLKVTWLCPLCHKEEHRLHPTRTERVYPYYGVEVVDGKKLLHRFWGEENLLKWLATKFGNAYQTFPTRKEAKPILDRIKAGEKIKFPVEI